MALDPVGHEERKSDAHPAQVGAGPHDLEAGLVEQGLGDVGGLLAGVGCTVQHLLLGIPVGEEGLLAACGGQVAAPP